MDYVLQAKEVSKSFAGNMAVDHVSIGMRKGDIYGFIGENGAGKTTLMRMVCGLAEPSEGEITLFGSCDLVSQRHKVGCTIENPALYPAMTAMENMEAQRLLLGITDDKVCARLLDTILKAEEIISHMFENPQFECTPENSIRLKGHVEDAGRINEQLVRAGIHVSALMPEGEKLEDYFMRLMGGVQYA